MVAQPQQLEELFRQAADDDVVFDTSWRIDYEHVTLLGAPVADLCSRF
jgi:hypothetical protein